MKAYLISLFCAAIVASLVGILSPSGESGGIGRHLGLVIALFMLCTLISPLTSVIRELYDLAGGTVTLPDYGENAGEQYEEQLGNALQNASTEYFAEMLTQTLEREFSIPTGEVRSAVRWSQGEDGSLSPDRVTVVLSGSAIWKDPSAIEHFVTKLLGCECVTAIE